jgi:protein-tyrosine phosphatase
MLFEKLTHRYGLEWNENGTTTAEELCDDELVDTVDSKQKLAICLANAKLVCHDGKPIAIPMTENIFLGSIGSAYNLSGLKEENITHILCLSSIIKKMFPLEFIYKRVDMKDSHDFDMLGCMEECFSFIQTCRCHNGGKGKILIHCYQGKSRSVAIIMAYLIKFHNMTVAESLDAVKSVRPMACPNNGFMYQLQKFWEQIWSST